MYSCLSPVLCLKRILPSLFLTLYVTFCIKAVSQIGLLKRLLRNGCENFTLLFFIVGWNFRANKLIYDLIKCF